MRFFLTLAYKGTAYSGWQIQDNAPSVQAALQGALSVLLGEPTEVVGAGRTDAGVHAAYYVAHFDTVSEKLLDESSFIYHLNAILPKDIAAFGVKRVADEAHARFSATRREYKYYLTLEKDPFRTETAYRYPLALDMDRMNQAATILLEQSDFESFCKADGNNKTTICRIFASGWTKEGNLLIYTIAADRFLRNMVRAIVGTLIDVGRGKLSVDGFRAIIEAKSRCAAGTSAPAHGLFLTDVHYPEHLLR